MTRVVRQQINTGSYDDDPSADSIRDAFTKININEEAMWDAGAIDSDIVISENKISVDATNSDLIIEANQTGIIQLSSFTKVASLACDNLGVTNEMTVGILNVSVLRTGELGTVESTININADNINVNNLTASNPTILDSSLIINAGASQFLKVTDGNAVSPVDLFSVNGETGEVICNGDVDCEQKFTAKGDLSFPVLDDNVAEPNNGEGGLGDKKGDVRITEKYIYVCIQDWEDTTPSAQPEIWKRAELSSWTP